MNRRSFLTRAAAAVIGALVLDPEQLLWVPGQRTFFDVRNPIQVGSLVWFDSTDYMVWHERENGNVKRYGSYVSRDHLHVLTGEVPLNVQAIGVLKSIGPDRMATIVTGGSVAALHTS